MPEQLTDSPHPPVEERVGVRCAVRGDPEDFQALAVIEPAAHGPAGDGHADELAVLGCAEGELAPDRGLVMPVVLGHESIGLTEMQRNRLHAVCRRLG